MQKIRIIFFFLSTMLLIACYNHGQQTPDAWDLTKQQIDSISFSTTHHYSQNYNFVVNASRLPLADALPDMAFDTMYVVRGERVVVAEIKTVPSDTIDSVWVKVARDQITQGWIRESELLEGVSPDDPISQFIDLFTNNHLMLFLGFCVLAAGLYALRRLSRRNAYIVHFHDIATCYPTLLTITLSTSAVLYASIQKFVPSTWVQFYYHPTLNPFGLPFILTFFLCTVWLIIILSVATLDEVSRQLRFSEAIMYLFSLFGVCVCCYMAFTVLTLYWVGYPLFVMYVVWALWRYIRFSRPHYVCGKCGSKLHSLGRCPHCGAMNTDM